MNRRMLGVLLAVLVVIAGVLTYFLINTFQSPTGSSPGTTVASASPTDSATVVTGQGCGVTKTSTGYTFSWLHVSNGVLVDARNCIVDLKGFNWSQLEFGNAVGGGKKTRISEQNMAWYSQTFKMNAWRIPVNAYWWNTNVDVPLAGMKYQDWIQQIVGWAEKYGNYVILTKGPQFHDPPCGGSIAFCPPQNQGAQTGDPQQTTTGQYIDQGVAMWTGIAKIYANDPAVLYDSWNEMHDIDAQTWQKSENTLIDTIRAQNPRSVILLGGPNFKGNIKALMNGSVPDFTQSNLVYDFHVYNGYTGSYAGKNCSEPNSDLWKAWPTNADSNVGFAQQHGKAVSFTEWGGCYDFDQYNQALTSYARAHHICLTYYDESNVIGDSFGVLNDNGTRVQAAYMRW